MLLKDRIVAQSTNLFVRNGVKSVRMDDIASRLGVSKRTIYELFGDRESLIVECVRHFYASQDEKHDRRVPYRPATSSRSLSCCWKIGKT